MYTTAPVRLECQVGPEWHDVVQLKAEPVLSALVRNGLKIHSAVESAHVVITCLL